MAKQYYKIKLYIKCNTEKNISEFYCTKIKKVILIGK